jgi:anti-anti-sigma regulatory factor
MPSIILPAALTITAAAALRQALLTELAEPGALTLDASAVTQADSAGLQLLLAVTRTGTPVHLSQPSPAIQTALHRYGFTQEFAA